ncbi:MAG TPA: S24 family peptidase [Kaistia sp.]|jgi:phage repressor protein C with HTH and peptisase S24 domain|nr:S24 family peptidase [Kaistia sp.]
MSNQLKTRIKERLDTLGLSPRAASLRVGTNGDLIRGLIREGVDPNPTTETLNRVAAALETTTEWLMGLEEGPPPVIAQPDVIEVREAQIGVFNSRALPQDVAVLGTAAGSIIHNVDGFTIESDVIEFVRRPPALAGVKDLYAIFVVGSSMFPAHPEGEVRFVHPRRPYLVGDTVIVQTRTHDDDPGQAYIKVLAKKTPAMLVLQQFNPNATIEIPMEYVRSVHKVLTMNEMFGI